MTNSPRSFFITETYFTRQSDSHKLVISVFKTTFSKTRSKEIIYRDFKNFDQEIFSQEVHSSLSSERAHEYTYTSFEDNFLEVLNKHVPLKKKVLRASHAPYVTKALRKAIMKMPCLEKLYFKKKKTESLKKSIRNIFGR